MRKMIRVAVCAVIFTMTGDGLATGALAAGDPDKGKKIFARCKACHVPDSETHKIGPHLVNIFGREAGTVDGFKKFSKSMKESGIVWDEATLDAYIENPRKVVKGGSMAFAGLRRAKDRADVIAYMKQFSQ